MQFNATLSFETNPDTHWASNYWTVFITSTPSEKPALDACQAALDQQHPQIRTQQQNNTLYNSATPDEYELHLYNCNPEVYALVREHLPKAPSWGDLIALATAAPDNDPCAPACNGNATGINATQLPTANPARTDNISALLPITESCVIS